VCEALLPWAAAPEPGSQLEILGTGGRAVGRSVFSAAGQQSEFWCREGAALGLLRLSGGAQSSPTTSLLHAVQSTTPAFHGDRRYIPGLCRGALRRLRSAAQATAREGHCDDGVAKALLPHFEMADESSWANLVAAAEGEDPPPEPWLATTQACSVQWLD
jgi:hypothetical protein